MDDKVEQQQFEADTEKGLHNDFDSAFLSFEVEEVEGLSSEKCQGELLESKTNVLQSELQSPLICIFNSGDHVRGELHDCYIDESVFCNHEYCSEILKDKCYKQPNAHSEKGVGIDPNINKWLNEKVSDAALIEIFKFECDRSEEDGLESDIFYETCMHGNLEGHHSLIEGDGCMQIQSLNTEPKQLAECDNFCSADEGYLSLSVSDNSLKDWSVEVEESYCKTEQIGLDSDETKMKLCVIENEVVQTTHKLKGIKNDHFGDGLDYDEFLGSALMDVKQDLKLDRYSEFSSLIEKGLQKWSPFFFGKMQQQNWSFIVCPVTQTFSQPTSTSPQEQGPLEPAITPRQVLERGLESYFESLSLGTEASLEEQMTVEWLRLRSFSSYRGEGSAHRLAQNGFYMVGDSGKETRCFSCGLAVSDWKFLDNIEERHRKQSPTCRLLENEGSGNVPINSLGSLEGSSSIQQNQGASRVSEEAVGTASAGDIANKRDTENCPVYPTSKGLTTIGQQEPNKTIKASAATLQPLTRNTRAGDEDEGPISPPVGNLHFFSQPVVIKNSGLGYSGDPRQQTVVPTPVTSVRAEQASSHCKDIKHPQLATLASRIQSFGTGSQLSHLKSATEMAEAGFFYTGKEDYVRCFSCDGGLRDWEPRDDPLVEHARWYPRCEYILNLKGEKYVRDVLRKQDEQGDRTKSRSVPGRSTVIKPQLPREDSGQGDISKRDVKSGRFQRYKTQHSSPQTNRRNETSIYSPKGPDSVLIKGAEKASSALQFVHEEPYRSFHERFVSYHGWPHESYQTPMQMSQAGFFFSGSGDTVECFCCGLRLKNWQAGDDPLKEHVKGMTSCQYIKNLKGESFIAEIKAEESRQVSGRRPPARNEQAAVFARHEKNESEKIIEQLQDMGYSVNISRQAVQDLRGLGRTRLSADVVANYLLDKADKEKSGTQTSGSGARQTTSRTTTISPVVEEQPIPSSAASTTLPAVGGSSHHLTSRSQRPSTSSKSVTAQQSGAQSRPSSHCVRTRMSSVQGTRSCDTETSSQRHGISSAQMPVVGPFEAFGSGSNIARPTEEMNPLIQTSQSSWAEDEEIGISDEQYARLRELGFTESDVRQAALALQRQHSSGDVSLNDILEYLFNKKCQKKSGTQTLSSGAHQTTSRTTTISPVVEEKHIPSSAASTTLPAVGGSSHHLTSRSQQPTTSIKSETAQLLQGPQSGAQARPSSQCVRTGTSSVQGTRSGDTKTSSQRLGISSARTPVVGPAEASGSRSSNARSTDEMRPLAKTSKRSPASELRQKVGPSIDSAVAHLMKMGIPEDRVRKLLATKQGEDTSWGVGITQSRSSSQTQDSSTAQGLNTRQGPVTTLETNTIRGAGTTQGLGTIQDVYTAPEAGTTQTGTTPGTNAEQGADTTQGNVLVHGTGQSSDDENDISLDVWSVGTTTAFINQNGPPTNDCPAFSISYIEEMKRENDSLKKLMTCCICLERSIAVAFLPCGHFVCCQTCHQLLGWNCPVCRTRIRGKNQPIYW